jgi:replicative DNA helicase
MLYEDFIPTMTRFTRDDPRVQSLDKKELIKLLPISMQNEIKRAEWAWANIDELAYGKTRDKSQVVIDPYTQRPVSETRFTRDQILLLFDPGVVTIDEMDEEDQLLAYIASDPVIWSRFNLKVNPRIYQTIALRDESDRTIFRFGRRCGKTMTTSIESIYDARINSGHISMFIAPMKAHCEVIWKTILTLLRNNPDFAEELRRRKISTKEQPYLSMTFPNGSVIKIFTSGVKSNSKGDSIRGQEADALYLDEVDLMNPDDRPAFQAILRSTGRPFKKKMRVSSTPSGRRDMMYEYSTLFRDEYTEYYLPTHAALVYTKRDDKEQKKTMSKDGYFHEILALYGEESSGVFLKAHLDKAQSHFPEGYDYLSINEYYRAHSSSKLVVGVDWDKFGAGCNIVMCLIDYSEQNDDDPKAGRLTPLARWEVPRGPEVLHQATEFVKTVYNVYRPDAIYVDRGYGDFQLEELTLASKNEPRCAGLDKVLKGIHFAEKITLYDPITGKEIKKEIKDYMVTLTIKMFEEDKVILNSRDYENVPGSTDMIKQFEGYQIVRRTSSGLPVYEAASTTIGDHALDAFMMCVLAMHQEWGDFTRKSLGAAPKALNLSIQDIMSTTQISLRSEEEKPDRFHISRTNIGRPSRGGKRIKRRSF